MSRAIVTVRRHDLGAERDLEVPVDVPCARLVAMVTQALQWTNLSPERLQVRAEPHGMVLGPNESLSQAGVGEGAWLILEPLGTSHPSPIHPAEEDSSPAPAAGWRPLGATSPAPAPEAVEPAPGPGFTWKKVR